MRYDITPFPVITVKYWSSPTHRAHRLVHHRARIKIQGPMMRSPFDQFTDVMRLELY